MTERIKFAVPTALEYFSALVADDASLSLVEAAASVAQDDHPDLDIAAVLEEVDTLAERLKRRIPADAVAMQRLRMLNRYFFAELGFAGNVNDYYAVSNSHLHAVLASRRGIPITLAILYIELASHVGLAARGVSFPGHFLVKLRMSSGDTQGEVLIDPFTGHSLSREELDDRLAPYKRAQGLVGNLEPPLGVFLRAATPRDVLARLLRNLKEIHRNTHDGLRLLAVQRRLTVLLPDAWDEVRDRGFAFADLGQDAAAMMDLRSYLQHCADAPDCAEVRARIRSLSGQGRPRLH